MKKCSTCKIEKELGDFHKNTKHKDGHASKCKPCAKAYQEGYYKGNKETVLSQKRSYYTENRESAAAQMKLYRDKNKESLASAKRIWQSENRGKCNANGARYKAAKGNATPRVG